MTDRYDDHQDTAQLRARQVGEIAARLREPHTFEDSAHAEEEIDQQVERVRWLMRREPMLEREMLP
jgi:hypothetical protein